MERQVDAIKVGKYLITKTQVATFVQDQENYAVLVNGEYKHLQNNKELSLSKYQKLIIKNHPEYNFTTEEEPLDEVSDNFNPNVTDPDTGEIKEPKPTPPPPVEETVEAETIEVGEYPQEKFINPLKSNNMETNTEEKATQNATQEQEAPQVEKVKLRRLRRISTKGTEVGIKVVSRTLIASLLLTADILVETSKLVAKGEAVLIKPLGTHPDLTRRELAEQATDSVDKFLTDKYRILHSIRIPRFGTNPNVQPA